MTTGIGRREFLRRGALAGGGVLSIAALERLSARQAKAATTGGRPVTPATGYGALAPAKDQRGQEILGLPSGFSYVTFGAIGDVMSDGSRTPVALDGMAAFPGPRKGSVRLIRNHEDRNAPGEGSVGGSTRKYDALAGGGTTTLDLDLTSRSLVRDFVSLNGTIVNCAGGISYQGRSWITCEETVAGPEHGVPAQRFPKRHGYAFEVPVSRGAGGLRTAEPIVAMGRFAHEALAVDQRTGIVYQTEDAGSGIGSGFYRFIPEDPKHLQKGGKLQMLACARRPGLQPGLRQGRCALQPPGGMLGGRERHLLRVHRQGGRVQGGASVRSGSTGPVPATAGGSPWQDGPPVGHLGRRIPAGASEARAAEMSPG